MLDREALEAMLAEGCSLEEIGRRAGRHPSTISYWLRKHGLTPNGAQAHAARGGISEETLARLVAEGLSGRQIAARCQCSLATVRHWLRVYGLETQGTRRRRALMLARDSGEEETVIDGRHCGPSTHRLMPNRGFVCLACRARAVTDRRRLIKSILVAEAGGCCARCGFADSLAALQFHHTDPRTKEFPISARGVTRSLERARAEAAKCVLLCANCHAAVEAGHAALP